jgi:(1->4)-alpha-D-glucan 1-alpha-D-glucosylmutase
VTPPRATYRLQFSRDFGFDSAARIAPYLAALGISHVYASPYLKARPGSTHGYDIVAHDALNPELGDSASFSRMCEAFAQAGLKQILDFVPNHMGVGGADNPLWLEVLEWGPLSPFAGWFDIDWEPASRYLTEKLLVPVLGDQYGAALDDGKLELKFDGENGEFAVWAYDTHKLPICPLQYADILGDSDPDLERIGDEFAALMEWRPQMERRADELKRELAHLIYKSEPARTKLERALLRLNGRDQAGRVELDALIQAQFWRASHFRVAGDDINYRRFFNVNDLAGLRIELPEVFEHAHQLVFKLLRDGVLDGLRIDHIDGLLDPKAYLHRLRESALLPDGSQRPYFLVVEKILGRDEQLPDDWPVEGTTGYEFANLVAHLMLPRSAGPALTRVYREFTGERMEFAAIVRECKFRIMKNEMASELNVLARDAARVARQNSRTADFTRNILRRALRELIACFPVYRTYLNGEGHLAEVERRELSTALDTARRKERDIDPSVFDFLEALLTGDLVSAPRSGFSRHAALRCAMKVQQYSGPVMAKGLEDTAFYRFNRLIALNEVGGFPEELGLSIVDFHAANAKRARNWPQGLLATSTHDTKRGEDARARLLVLGEIPDEWSNVVRDWHSILREPGAHLNDANTEYFIYQLLLGSWPDDLSELQTFQERARSAVRKSLREAKVHTTWAKPDENYEGRAMQFVDAAFANPAFLQSFSVFQRKVAMLGASNSVVQLTLKLTLPGIPDIYQGAELWDLSLVDPDNRRAVDYDLRAKLLARAQEDWRADPQAAIRLRFAQSQDGSLKQLITWLLLQCRAEHPELFSNGSYTPCEVVGDTDQRLLAFSRVGADCELLVVAALFRGDAHAENSPRQVRIRLPAPRGPRAWRHLLHGHPLELDESFPVEDVLRGFPVAVLIRAVQRGLGN